MDPFEIFCHPDFREEEQPRDSWDVISEVALWFIGSVAVIAVCGCVAFVAGWKLA